MKAIKKILLIAMTAVLIFAAVAFAGCNRGDGAKDTPLTGSMKIVMTVSEDAQATVLTVDLKDFTSNDKAFDVVDALAEQGKICYKGTKGIYGMYLTAIGVPQGEGENKYDSYILEEDTAAKRSIFCYTNVAKDMDDGEYSTEVKYEGVTLKSSLQSVSKMTIEDGAIIYFTYTYWG